MDAAPTISTQGLTRRFGDLVAVDGVDLRVSPGQFFGFLGPNGAGKSTTIKMLTGLLAPSSGRIEILGLDLTAQPVEVKRQIGVVPEGMALFGRLTGSEFTEALLVTRSDGELHRVLDGSELFLEIGRAHV